MTGSALGSAPWSKFQPKTPAPASLIPFLPLRPLPQLSSSPLQHVRSSSPPMPTFHQERLSFFPPLSFSLSLSLSHSSPLPPPPVLCVRVCRWPSLAGSVTRGNWGRVHFHRTNGNKLICFHCCVFETVF